MPCLSTTSIVATLATWRRATRVCMRDVKDKYTRVHLLSAFLRAKDPIDKRERSEFLRKFPQ